MANLFDTPTRSSGNLFDSPVTKKKRNLTTVDGLVARAGEVGLGDEAENILDKENKLSFFQRLGAGLGAFNPAEAILTGTEEGAGRGVLEYGKGIVQGIGSAVTGRDFDQTERRTFSDVAEKLGVENRIAKAGIGFLGDVLLDPSTYFGGAIARGIGAGAKGVGKIGLRGVEKVAPDVATGLKVAGEGLQDALGAAFQFGYKSSRGATQDVMALLSKEQQAKVGLAASNLDRLGTGVLAPAQREELALKMIAGKRAEFVAREINDGANSAALKTGKFAREAAKSDDAVVQKLIEDQSSRAKKFAEGITENPYETYFPFIKKDKVERFIRETQGIRVGSEGYRKQFKNLLTNENLELDPAKAFFTRESQIVSDRIIRDGLRKFVKKYGQPLDAFKNADEARKAGFELIREKGIFMGKEIGYVPKWDAKLLRDSVDTGFQTVNMLAKATGFDAVTSLFKRAVTGLFAPFHIRNYVSGIIQNFEMLGIDALNPKNIAVGQKIAYLMGKGDKLPSELIEVGGKQMKFDQLMKPFVNHFSGDTFFNTEFNLALDKGQELKQVAGLFSKTRIKETAKTLGLGQEAIPFKMGRAVGQFIEHQQKATAYVTALNQGKSIDEALKLAEAAGFDYRALTKFESQIMRRLIPFYSFTRKNLELQLKTLGENPQRINQVLAFFENASELGGGLTEEERNSLPEYLKDQLIVSFGKNALGQPIVAGGFGTPIEQPGQVVGKGFGDTVRRIASTLNPIIKVPLEKAFGKDFFYDRPLNEVVDAKQYQILPDFIKSFVAFREVQKKNKEGKTYTAYTADPEKLHILRNLPTTRLFSYLYEIYRTDTEGGARALNLTTGVKPRPIDLETVEYFRNKERQTELEELLIRAGVLKEFRRTYEPSN